MHSDLVLSTAVIIKFCDGRHPDCLAVHAVHAWSVHCLGDLMGSRACCRDFTGSPTTDFNMSYVTGQSSATEVSDIAPHVSDEAIANGGRRRGALEISGDKCNFTARPLTKSTSPRGLRLSSLST